MIFSLGGTNSIEKLFGNRKMVENPEAPNTSQQISTEDFCFPPLDPQLLANPAWLLCPWPGGLATRHGFHRWRRLSSHGKHGNDWLVVDPNPSENYESQLGLSCPICGKIEVENGSNHQPDKVECAQNMDYMLCKIIIRYSLQWVYI